jgi:hypothetical protein
VQMNFPENWSFTIRYIQSDGEKGLGLTERSEGVVSQCKGTMHIPVPILIGLPTQQAVQSQDIPKFLYHRDIDEIPHMRNQTPVLGAFTTLIPPLCILILAFHIFIYSMCLKIDVLNLHLDISVNHLL